MGVIRIFSLIPVVNGKQAIFAPDLSADGAGRADRCDVAPIRVSTVPLKSLARKTFEALPLGLDATLMEPSVDVSGLVEKSGGGSGEHAPEALKIASTAPIRA